MKNPGISIPGSGRSVQKFILGQHWILPLYQCRRTVNQGEVLYHSEVLLCAKPSSAFAYNFSLQFSFKSSVLKYSRTAFLYTICLELSFQLLNSLFSSIIDHLLTKRTFEQASISNKLSLIDNFTGLKIYIQATTINLNQTHQQHSQFNHTAR